MSFSPQDIKFIRSRVLGALSSNRAPGMNFAGYFFGFTAQGIETDGVEFRAR